jgi:hypothetical protein
MINNTFEWNEHLQHLLIFCRTHIQRNFQKKFGDHPAKHLLHLIWEAKSKPELLEHMDEISSTYPETKSWIDHKKTPWILAGLSPEQSKIPIEFWIIARKDTGVSESSHFMDNNFTGRRLSLLTTVLR